MIRLDKVSYCYRPEHPVIQDASIDLGLGLTLVVGPNGGGKSTLARLMAGVAKPLAGTVLIGGHDPWVDEVAARNRLAYVPESPDLSPYASIRTVLMLVAGLRNQRPQSVADALSWSGLEAQASETVRELSKGQRRRALLAAAWIGQPQQLILDEPFDGIDREFRSQVVQWIVDRRAAGAAIVLISHQLQPLSNFFDRVLVVQAGRCHLLKELPPQGCDMDLVYQSVDRQNKKDSEQKPNSG